MRKTSASASLSRSGPSPSRRRTIGLIALGAAAAALLGISVRHVPEGALIVRDAPLFETAPVLLAPGWHLAPPGIFRLSRYDAHSNELVFGDGEPLQFATPEGATVVATINLRFRLDPDQVLALHEQCEGDLTGWLAEQVEATTAKLIGSPEFVPLTRERVPDLESSGRRRLSEALKATGISIAGLRFERLGYEGAPLVASGPRPTSTRKVLWLAIDSFDWDLIRPLVEQGRMPNMKRLLATGAWGNLKSVPPLLSPVIWTSVATAKRPEKHGIVDFVATNPQTGAVVPVTSTLRTTRAFWNILSDAGVSVGVIAWWASFPAEKVHGFMVTDRVAYQLFKDRIQDLPEDDPLKTHPADLYGRIAPLIRLPGEVGNDEIARFIDVERHSAYFSADDTSRLNEFRTVLAASHTYAEIGMKLFTERPTDVRVVYFEGPDTASHLFMPFMPPRSDPVQPQKVEWFGDVVPEFYKYQDEWIGRFIDAFADDQTTIVLSSDHGFKMAGERPKTDSRISKGRAADWHQSEGMILFSGKDIRQGERILGASILDVVPTLLALYGLPVGSDMDGKVLTAALSKEFLTQHPVQEIASYDRLGEDTTSRFAQFTQDDQELLLKLQSLGYIQQSMPTASINQGTIYMQSGEYTEAILAFEAALKQTDKEPVRLNLARAYRLSGDINSAQRELDALLNRQWNRAAVLTEIAALQRDRQDWQGAERTLEEALESDPQFAEAHLHFARLYEQQRRWDEAVSSYRRSLEIDPSHAEAHNQIGVILQRQGDSTGAVRELSRAIELNPDLPGPYNNLGLVFRELGRIDRARQVLETGTTMAPRSEVLHNSLGSLQFDAGEIDSALRSFERALELNPDYSEAVANLATVYQGLENAGMAATYFARLAELEPENIDSHLSLALALIAQQRDRSAAQILGEVLEKEPRNFRGLVALGKLQMKHGRTAEAIDLLERAGEVDDSLPPLWNDLARLYLSEGRTRLAREALERSLTLEPDQPEISRHLNEIGG